MVFQSQRSSVQLWPAQKKKEIWRMKGRILGNPPTPGVRGKPQPEHIGHKNFDTLMELLAEDPESPDTTIGVFVSNSTKRKLRKQIQALFVP